MNHQELFDKIVKRFASGVYEKELHLAREEYSKIAGKIFDDDKSYMVYTSFFLEWYILERPLDIPGKPPVEAFLEISDPFITHEERDLCRQFMKSIHSIFEVKGQKKEYLLLTDLHTGEKYKTFQDKSVGFKKGVVVETRLFPGTGYFSISTACRFHPSSANKLIAKELKRKWKNKEGDIKNFMWKLAYMNLLWERSRNINLNDIYKW